MRMCGACGGSGQDPRCSRSADCLTCEGVGFLSDGGYDDIPANDIYNAIEILEEIGESGSTHQSDRFCKYLAERLQEWFNEA